MIAFVFTTCLVGPVLWFLFRFVATRNSRTTSNAFQTLPASGQNAPPGVDGLDDTATPMWTALDDHQLTRLLKSQAS